MATLYDHYRLDKIISSHEEFAIAVKAPSEIEEVLKNIHEAKAKGRSSEDLHN